MTESASAARYFQEIGRYALLTREQEVALAERIQRGDRAALHEMVTANLRLVVMVAKRYTGLGLPLEDLISEGNLGLVRAAELFDPGRGCRFSSYAVPWIKQAVFRALNEQAGVVRVPLHKAQALRKAWRVAAQLEARLGRRAADDEIAAAVNISPRDLANARAAALTVTSLDAPLASAADGDDSTLAEVLPDEQAADAARETSQQDLAVVAMALMDGLSERERKILEGLFGLRGDSKNFSEVANDFGVSRGTVFNLRNAALAKLRQRLHNLEFHL